MNMKTLRLLSGITLVLLPISTVLAAPVGQITQSSGYVTVTAPNGVPKTAVSGEPIEVGQTISTGDGGKAVLKFQDGQVFALQSKTIFKVNSYKYDQGAPEKGESSYSLMQGGLRAITGEIGSKNRAGWKLATPTATVKVQGTDFMVVINQSVFVKVDSGAIAATNSAGTSTFAAGQTGAIASGSSLGAVAAAGSVPAGTFGELAAIDVAAVGGSAAGATGMAGGTILGIPTGVVIGVGIAAGAAIAASNGSNSTTSH